MTVTETSPVDFTHATHATLADLVDRLAGLVALVAEPAENPTDPLTGVLEIAVSALPGVAWAALSERNGRGQSRTLAATDPVVRDYETAQFRLGEGPTLEALSRGSVVLVPDLHADDRWPRLSRHLDGRCPVRGVLSRPLRPTGPAARTLTLYGRDAAFGEHVVGGATAVTLTTAETALAGLVQRTRAANLHRALMSNRRIGVAIGILMTHRQWTEEQAFAAMGEASQALNRKLRDLAEDVALTGELPELPAGPAT